MVVSHAGSGTFLGALAEGLPQLCLPQAADQFRNSEGARRAGVAAVLHPDESSPEAIAERGRRAPRRRRRAPAGRGVAAEIAAMPAPARWSDPRRDALSRQALVPPALDGGTKPV